MTIWISWEPPLFTFKRLDISRASQMRPSQMLWPFEFVESLRVQFRASRYIMRRNWRSKWEVMTIRISWQLPWFVFECLEISWASRYTRVKRYGRLNLPRASCWVSSVSIYFAPESEIRVKCYDHFNLLSAFFVHFQPSRYIVGIPHTNKSKVMADWICRELHVEFQASRYIMR